MGIIEFIRKNILNKEDDDSFDLEEETELLEAEPIETASEGAGPETRNGMFAQTEPTPDVVFTKHNSYCSPDFFKFMMACNTEAMEKDGLSTAERKIPFSVSDCDTMEGHEFEKFCAQLFADCGYSDVTVTRGSGDQGIDILARKDGVLYGVQCKRYSNSIGNKAIQEAYSGRCYYGCDVAIVLTTNYFTDSAVDLAKRTGVLTWDRKKLEYMIERSGGVPENIKKMYQPYYLPEEYRFTKGYVDNKPDPLLYDAIDIVLETGMASSSMLQRRLKLGYSRAAKIVDQMEENGIVGPFEGARPRKILITKGQWASMKLNTIKIT